MLSCINQGRNVCRSWGFYILTNFTIHFTLYLISRFWTIYIYIYYIYIHGLNWVRLLDDALDDLFFSEVCFIKTIETIVKRLWTEGEVKLGVPFITFLLWKSAFFVSSGCIYNRFIMSCHEQVCLIMFNEKYYFERYFFHHWAIVGILPISAAGGLSLQPNFQKGGGAWQDLKF